MVASLRAQPDRLLDALPALAEVFGTHHTRARVCVCGFTLLCPDANVVVAAQYDLRRTTLRAEDVGQRRVDDADTAHIRHVDGGVSVRKNVAVGGVNDDVARRCIE